ncbi:hypothetical protein PQU92_05895 [Asticcacaulis sp. BYS171W]|uniref:Uncharacterized protein n=1 Tax=Asticcacaulis aquaticus TaxID=2984212 RepID=A0ABT5HRV5_9CAUL|nr:hypothetical protein [Asticcacaulis aquaticus]MDC7682798.1 hypothetical protein [Asticcacaulis aquaticus]
MSHKDNPRNVGSGILRTVLAVMVTPFLPGLILGALLLRTWGDFSFALMISGMIGYPALLLVGLPTHLLLLKLQRPQIWGYLIAGLVAGVAIWGCIVIWPLLDNADLLVLSFRDSAIPILLVSVAFSLLCAAAFWLMAVARFAKRT